NVNATYKGQLHKIQASDWHHPCCSGLQVQGTAISPAARNLIIKEDGEFVKPLPQNWKIFFYHIFRLQHQALALHPWMASWMQIPCCVRLGNII
ncbi:hypothetical protein, partial [Blautia sp.]